MAQYMVVCDEIEGITPQKMDLSSAFPSLNSDLKKYSEKYPESFQGFPFHLIDDNRVTFSKTSTTKNPNPNSVLHAMCKTKRDAMELVDYLSDLLGEIPSEVYHRWIWKV